MSQLPEPGAKFARYEVRSLLGAGGMGAVFLAVDPSLGRRVALKVMHVQDEDARARFAREARAAAALSHPHVVTIYEVGEHEGQPFLAMEFVEGESLRAHVARDDLALIDRVRVLSDVAHALAATHEAGLVHRDVKPENILVTISRRGKLLDFGIARPTGPVDASTPTESGSAVSFQTRAAFPDAMQLRAHALWTLGRHDEAEKQLVDCVARNPESQCQMDLTTAYMGRGACDKMLAQSRSYVAESAGTTGAYELFAKALAATGAADEAVTAAAKRSQTAKGDWRGFVDGTDTVRLAVLRGRFDDAIKVGRELAKTASGVESAEPHNQAMYLLGGALDEIGQDDEALKLARQHLAARASWARGSFGDRGTPLAFAIVDRSGTPPHPTVWKDATAWLIAEKSRMRDTSELWRIAELAHDADEGRALLNLLPVSFDTLATPKHEALVGRAQLLVGDADGVDRIATAARSCDALSDPLLNTRANLWLGDALAKKGDQAGACSAYAVVSARWGKDPRSRTARAAALGARALKCASQ